MRLANSIRRFPQRLGRRLRRLRDEAATDPYRDALGVAARHRHGAAPGTDTDLCRRLQWWR